MTGLCPQPLSLKLECPAGGAFDPLGLTQADEDRTFKLKTAEIKHARLAMVAALGAPAEAVTGWHGTLPHLLLESVKCPWLCDNVVVHASFHSSDKASLYALFRALHGHWHA